MNYLVKSDLYRYRGKTDLLCFLNAFIMNPEPGFRFSYFLRKASCCKKYSLLRIVYKFFHRHYKFRYGFQIPIRTIIGEGLYIGHFGYIVINENVQIGKNCNISHGVTIGQANRGKLKGCPVIGDEVWIGAGAAIVEIDRAHTGGGPHGISRVSDDDIAVGENSHGLTELAAARRADEVNLRGGYGCGRGNHSPRYQAN